MFLPVSVCLSVHLLPTYLKTWWTYLNFILRVWSLIQEEELIQFWLRYDSRWLTDRFATLQNPFLIHNCGLDKDIDLKIGVYVDCT